MSTELMTAAVTTGHGGLDKLELRELPVPRPSEGEVLVRVGACGLNNTDIWVRQGAYGTDKDPDAVTGTGRVEHMRASEECRHTPPIQTLHHRALGAILSFVGHS